MIGRCSFIARNHYHTISVKMPKNKNKTDKGGKNEEKSSVVETTAGPVTVNKGGNILIKILAKPGAKANNITDIGVEAVGVQINAPPVEGEANTELVRYLADVLDLRKSEVCLQKGSKSRQKTIVVSSDSITVPQVLLKLKAEMEKS